MVAEHQEVLADEGAVEGQEVVEVEVVLEEEQRP